MGGMTADASRRPDLRNPWVRTVLLLALIGAVAGVSSLIERDRADVAVVDTVVAPDGSFDLDALIGLDAEDATAILEADGFAVDTQPLVLSDLGGLRAGMVTDVSVEHNQPLVTGARLILTVVEQAR